MSILGILHVAFGALGLVAAGAMLVLFGGAAGIVSLVGQREPDALLAAPILGLVAVGLFGLLAVLSLPGLVVGIGLLRLRPWARVGGLILSALNLLNFPLGTLIGGYGLWVLLSPETESIFR